MVGIFICYITELINKIYRNNNSFSFESYTEFFWTVSFLQSFFKVIFENFCCI